MEVMCVRISGTADPERERTLSLHSWQYISEVPPLSIGDKASRQ